MFRDYGEARSEIARMIDFYNNVRPPHEHRQQEAARRVPRRGAGQETMESEGTMKTGPTDNTERPAAPGLRHRWVFLGMGRNSKYGPRDGWVFLGMGRNSKYGCKNAGAALIETPAHTCRFAQPYSSWSCTPAEPHYASGCGAKVAIPYENAK